MRLDRYLVHSGIGSRKEVKQIIKQGWIAVNNVVEKDSGRNISPVADQVSINQKTIVYKQFHYLMMNKPNGVISATTDNKHNTVIDLLPEQYKFLKLFPFGRLDRDTEGLLILSDDGQLAHRLLSPRKHVSKTYYAVIDEIVTQDDIEIFLRGLKLDDDFITLPADLKILESGNPSKIELTIYEGKFHQVKRMFQSVNKKVIYLKRIAMGNLSLDNNLAVGQVRELTEDEILLLRNSIE